MVSQALWNKIILKDINYIIFMGKILVFGYNRSKNNYPVLFCWYDFIFYVVSRGCDFPYSVSFYCIIMATWHYLLNALNQNSVRFVALHPFT